MSLKDPQQPVPYRFVTPDFVLHRQRLADNDMDYEAVMDSKEILREWSGSSWPEDDFTPAQNAEDLAEHIDDFEKNIAYGFSIFVPSEDRLLGSLYIDPVMPFAEDYRISTEARVQLESFDARVEYWLRRGVREDFERTFLSEVPGWLGRAWWFERVAFGSRRGMEARRNLYHELGLSEVARLVSNDGTRVFYFHAVFPQVERSSR